MYEDWVTPTVAATMAKRDRKTIQRAARTGRLGPLARLETSPRGPYWLVHPILADPDVYRDVVGTCGQASAATERLQLVIKLALEMIAAVDDLGAQREAALVIRAVRADSPVVASRLTNAWGRCVQAGMTPDEPRRLALFRAATAAMGKEE